MNTNNSFTAQEAISAAIAHLKEAPGFDLCNYSTAAAYKRDWRKADARRKQAKEAWRKGVNTSRLAQLMLEATTANNGQGRLYRNERGEARWAGHVYSYGPIERWDSLRRLIEQTQAE